MRPIDAYTVNMQLVELYNQENNFAVKNALRNAMQVIANAPTIAPPPNDPLTLDEMREIVQQLEFCGYECEGGPLSTNIVFIRLKELAYRRKPEECATDG